jgi:multidrug resistance efflux pump
MMGFVRQRELDAANARADAAEEARRVANDDTHAMGAKLADANRARAYLQAELDVANAKLAEAQDRLSRIIASETPGMANIGRRLLRIAKGEG